MLDVLLAVYLWVIVFSLFCWLTTPLVEDEKIRLIQRIDCLKLIQARKVATKLGIRQKIKNKDIPKLELIRLIKIKVETHEHKVSQAVDEVLATSKINKRIIVG